MQGRILTGFWVAALVGACSSDIGIEDTVPAQPGFSMPDGGGAAITEQAACERITTALDETRSRLSCPAVDVECPGYIRPAGSAACLEFDEATVAACESRIRAYGRCADFDQRQCIVAAIPGSRSAGCVRPDAGQDATSDASADSSADAPVDGGSDTGAEAGDDAGDAASDAGPG